MAQTVTLIPGDGIGPDLTDSVEEVISALDVGIEWEIAEAGEAVMDREGTPLPESVLESIRRNKVAIKGPLTTPVGTGFRSVNVALRKELDLYGNIRPSLSLPGVDTPFENIDLIIYRENTEDLYAGVEHMVGKHAAESIKIITREGTERICRMAFERSKEQGRKHITVVHKANIMKYTDGLFRDVFFEPVHGSAPKYAGQNRANPLATLLSAKNMLVYLGYNEEADRMQGGIEAALKNPETRTKDLGGTAGPKEVTQAIVSNL